MNPDTATLTELRDWLALLITIVAYVGSMWALIALGKIFYHKDDRP